MAFAVSLALANGTDHRGFGAELHLCRVHGLVTSLRLTGWQGDVVCLQHGFSAGSGAMEMLLRLCTHVFSPPPIPFDGGPGGRRAIEFARANGRIPPPPYSKVQVRHDAERTSLKLQAWRLTQYDLVLHTDTDVIFTESPGAMFERAHADGLIFHAQRQWGGRGYWGISSHLMLLRPSNELASVLASNSAQGHFVPYTLGEQEVVESVFSHTVTSLPARQVFLPRHVHHGWLGIFKAFQSQGVQFPSKCDWITARTRHLASWQLGAHLWACCDGTPCEKTTHCSRISSEDTCRHHSHAGARPCVWSANATCSAQSPEDVRLTGTLGRLPVCGTTSNEMSWSSSFPANGLQNRFLLTEQASNLREWWLVNTSAAKTSVRNLQRIRALQNDEAVDIERVSTRLVGLRLRAKRSVNRHGLDHLPPQPALRAGSLRRFAVVLSVLSMDGLLASNHSRSSVSVCHARLLVSSLRATGWQGDVVCLQHGFSAGSDAMEMLLRLCTHVFSPPPIPFDGGPGGRRAIEFARANGRIPPPPYSKVQVRHDAERTSLKLQAWRLTQYDLVLHTDTDVIFTESPGAMFERAHADGLIFHAQRQWGGRGYWGISSHLMLLRPNNELASVLASNSAQGHFVPFSMTEQDVIEYVFSYTVSSHAGLKLCRTPESIGTGSQDVYCGRLSAADDPYSPTPPLFPKHALVDEKIVHQCGSLQVLHNSL